jgi:hypothetical protein
LARIGGVALVAALAAGCGSGMVNSSGGGSNGGGGSSATPKAAVDQAIANTAGASSYSTKMTIDLTGLNALTGSGKGAAPASIEPILQHGLSFTVTAGYSKAMQALEGSVTIPSLGTIGVIINGSAHTVYEKLPSSLTSIPGAGAKGAPAAVENVYKEIAAHPNDWLEVNTSKLGTDSALPGGLLNIGAYESKMIPAEQRAIKSATQVGATKVSGAAVTEYAVDFDLASYAKAAFGAVESMLPSSEKSIVGLFDGVAKALPTSMQLDFYVDGSGYARRISGTIPLGGMINALLSMIKNVVEPASGAGSSAAIPASVEKGLSKLALSVSSNYSNFGSTSTVVIPASNQVVDITPLLSTSPKDVSGLL